ncbi:MAG TPA: carboxypeptidase-like regulatory domain-containing protein, partial [Bryobacteraceae bacterium]|nr:carboxypeptidase-like regulatory domain-containing protein [Bryobacteraceae bacterium]
MKRSLWDAKNGLFFFCGACLLFLLASAASLKAQISYGSIVGTVTDSTNASVPGATVTVMNIATGERRTQQT